MRDTFRIIKKSFRRLGIQTSVNAAYFSGLGYLPRVCARFRNGQNHEMGRVWPFAVLLYHRISALRDPYFPGVGVDVFAAQMSYIAKNFNVVPLSQLIKDVERGVGVQRRTLAITFDDGYRDNFLYACPVLKEHQLPATVFVATGYTDTSRMMWNDRIAAVIKSTDRSIIHVEFPEGAESFSLDSDRAKLASLAKLLEKLKTLSDSNKNSVVESLVRHLGRATKTSDRSMLCWGELREMARSGWEIGSHSVEHRILSKVPVKEMHAEVTDSKKTLEEYLQVPIDLFAYPNGKEEDFGQVVKEAVQSAGYRAALTTLHGLNQEGFDLYKMRRISPWEERLPYFALRLEWMFWNSGGDVRPCDCD